MATSIQDNDFIVDVLPDEILLTIFSKLSLQDLLLCVRQVCSRWYRLSKDESLWKEVDFNLLSLGFEFKDKVNNSIGVRNLFEDLRLSVERIIFSNVSFDRNVYELFVSRRDDNETVNMHKLKSLDYSYSAVGIGSLCRALSLQTQLQELILVHTNVMYGEVMMEAIHLPFLKKLVFHDLHAWESLLDHRQESKRMYNKRATIQLSIHCTQLEWVELFTIWADLDNDVYQQFTKNCPFLKRLHLTWSTYVNSCAFVHSSACANITHLGLVDRQEIDPYLEFILPHFPNLVSLTVNGRNVHSNDCVALSKFCPNLEELVFELKNMRGNPANDCLFEFYLHQNNTLDGSKLQHIVEGCRKLKKLHAPCSNIDDDSILKLSLNCSSLEDINFMHCPLLTVHSLKSLYEHCQDLKFVNFQYTFHPDEYLKGLLSNCRRLKEVIFDSSSEVMGFPHSPLNSHRNSVCTCSNLSRLQDEVTYSSLGDDLPFIDMFINDENLGNNDHNVNKTNEIPEETISVVDFAEVGYEPVITLHCHLQNISFKNSTFSERLFQESFRLCPDLTQVALDGCMNLTNEVVITLVTCCRNLKVLMISSKPDHPSDISDVALDVINQYSRNLEILSVLYNRKLTSRGIFSIFESLDTTLRRLQSFSFCVGPNYGCKLPFKPGYGMDYLTERSKFCIRDGQPFELRILHLEFKERRTLKL